MQFLNSVNLRGVVGVTHLNDIHGKKQITFSLATQRCEKTQNITVVDVTWHTVKYWPKDNDPIQNVKKNDIVYVEGWISTKKYTRPDGTEYIMQEIQAEKISSVNVAKLEIESWKPVKAGYTIRIITMDDNNGKDRQAAAYNGKTGVVEYIDSKGQLHGTWGGLAINPDIDKFEIINS